MCLAWPKYCIIIHQICPNSCASDCSCPNSSENEKHGRCPLGADIIAHRGSCGPEWVSRLCIILEYDEENATCRFHGFSHGFPMKSRPFSVAIPWVPRVSRWMYHFRVSSVPNEYHEYHLSPKMVMIILGFHSFPMFSQKWCATGNPRPHCFMGAPLVPPRCRRVYCLKPPVQVAWRSGEAMAMAPWGVMPHRGL